MAIELLKPLLTFRGLSDDDEANDPNTDLGDEELVDDDEDEEEEEEAGEMMGGAEE